MIKSPEKIAEEIIAAMRSVIGDGSFTLHEPELDKSDISAVEECVRSGVVSSVGKEIAVFEEMLCEYTGAKKAVVVVNGTCGLHLALLASGVSNGDEVLVPALTFVATANAIRYCGAIPHFVESDTVSLGISVEKLSNYLDANTRMENGVCINKMTERPIRAIIPVHIFGHIGEIDGICKIASERNLIVVEDAAEALGSWSKGTHAGLFGNCGVISFNGNKIITTGGGGAILTDDEVFAARLKHLSTTAKKAHQFDFVHDEVGYNYRMPNLNAALGISQLKKLPRYLEEKRELQSAYAKRFAQVEGLRFLSEPDNCKSNFWLNAIGLPEANIAERDKVLHLLADAGYKCRPIWKLMSETKHFEGSPAMDLPAANQLARETINIPSSSFLSPRSNRRS